MRRVGRNIEDREVKVKRTGESEEGWRVDLSMDIPLLKKSKQIKLRPKTN